jgi:hypothetical protein
LHQGDKVLVGERGLAPAATGLREGRIRQVYPELDHGRDVGERTRVFVATGERPAVVIPRRYLASHHGVAYVRLERGGDVVVQPGLPMNDRIEILSGLQPGDRLVLPGAAAAAGSDGSGG